MFKKKGLLMFPMMLTVVATMIQGCGGQQAAQPGNDASPAAANNVPTHITWWHANGGKNGEAIDQIVSDFNASQSDIVVKAEFQGNYGELLNKLKASFGSASAPSLVMINDVNTRFMIDSGEITPVQPFIDRDQFDLSKMEEHIMNYYKVNDQFYSMPFNTSNAILYYNKDLFRSAGLDPETPPATFDEVLQTARALTKDNVSGFAFYIEPWFMEQSFAKQGELYVNNDNGRTAPATESYVNQAAGVKTLTWWKEMVDSGVALNLGRKGADAKTAFLSGQAAMYITSTGSLRSVVDGAEGKFEVGTGFFPTPADTSKEGGIAIGGGSNWILNKKSEEEQNAAWEFMEYLSSPKVQAYWHISSGYFPITTEAYDDPSVKENLMKYPQFQTAINQLQQTKSNFASQGASIAVFQEQREFVSIAVEEALNGKSPQEALDTAAANGTKALVKHNELNPAK
ncbi:ABC transporter substrate-binding protein [Paenibacillus sp. TRM 82003]|nr:ABC transporter substrate-binding protein [Paenibacillus sp. TRM 82003]